MKSLVTFLLIALVSS